MPVRTVPPSGPAPLTEKDPADATFTLTFTLLTPMMGGGVEINGIQKPCDPVTPIRVASIRGQLRFWWRACNRGKATTVAELREQEAKVWGSTSKPSAVGISVTQQPDRPEDVAVYKPWKGRWEPLDDSKAIAYGAFPLKPAKGSQELPGSLHRFIAPAFTLSIRCILEHRSAVLEAVNAWVLFGGLGGRTRRGFGAIEFQRAEPPCPEFVLDPARFVQRFGERPAIPAVPSLAGVIPQFREPSFTSSAQAWKAALGALQDFRQAKNLGRNPPRKDSRSPAGRSRWPEPDHIRRLCRQYAPDHKPEHPVQGFPRAAFGLPMIFHFSTQGDPNPPKPITLHPKDRTRLASPLILRPIRDGDQYRAMALVLYVAGPTLECVLDVNGLSTSVPVHLTADEAKRVPPLGGEPSPLKAFLRHFSASAKTKP